LSFDFMRGELQYEALFTEGGLKLKEATYTPTFVNNPVVTPALLVSAVPTTSGGNWTLGTYYNLTTARKTQTLIAETVYSADGTSLSRTSTTLYESPFHHQPTRTTSLTSKGETLETKNMYVFDFRISSCDNIADGNSTYNNDCATCLATFNSKRTDTSCKSQCLTTAYLNYQQCLSNARVAYVNYRKANFNSLSPLNTFQSNHNAAKSVADAELKPILELQDFYQNLPIETTKWRNGNLLASTFSRFDYTGNPAGKVQLNKVQKLNLAAPSVTFTAASTNASNNSIVKDSRYLDETLVTFYNGNLAEITGKDGIITSYLWGYNNIFPIAKATGINQANLSSAYAAVGGNVASLTALRTQPALNGSTVQLTTYTYAPLTGMISETNINGKSIRYEYDKLQRLLLARDFNNNILKQYDYQYQIAVPNTTPQWQTTGLTQCKPCPANGSYITNIMQQQEKDNNPSSSSYNTLRWTDIGISSSCVINPDWQNTSTPLTCQKDASNQNTGNQLQEQRDINPCSSTYNTLRNITIANTSACPLPSGCNSSNCTGPANKCINNACQTGTQVIVSSTFNPKTGIWTCTYRYQWSDGSVSGNYSYTSPTSCTLQ
jgi:hypothetical protein